MPLTVIARRGLSCPVIVCDYCQREIERGADGNYQWHLGDGPQATPIYFTHKACCRAFERAHPPPLGGGWLWGSMELTLLPVYVAGNLQIDVSAAERLADLMGDVT